MNKRTIIYSLVAIVALVLIEQVFVLTYINKQIFRISLFLIIPLIEIYIIKKSNIETEIQFERPTWKEFKVPFLVSIVIFVGTIGGYFMFQFMFDAQRVIGGAEELGIRPYNVVIWGVYLSFINSLIEEFFFRGYIYYALEKRSTKLAILGSSVLWSVYHVIIFITIFPLYTVIFTILGLVIIGVLLAYINLYGKSFINSWLVHIVADIAIVIIVLYMYTLV